MQSIKTAVSHFAQRVHTQFPGDSFTVMVRVRGGDMPPMGFEQARNSGTLGQHRFAGSVPPYSVTHNPANDIV